MGLPAGTWLATAPWLLGDVFLFVWHAFAVALGLAGWPPPCPAVASGLDAEAGVFGRGWSAGRTSGWFFLIFLVPGKNSLSE